ncbi:unnamed protein product, partial [Adineta steineri]
MTATSKNIELIVKQWTTFDLKTIQHDLDVTTTEIASRADESDQSRKKLVELSRDFKKNTSEDVRKAVAPILKSFQIEIDSLSKRSKAAEKAFLEIYRHLTELSDPVPALEYAQTLQRRAEKVSDLEVENQKLRETLDEYNHEFADVKNQEVTIKQLREKIKDLEDRTESNIQQRVKEKEKELQRIFSEKERQLQSQQFDLVTKYGEMEMRQTQLQSALDHAHQEMFEYKSKQDDVTSARSSEIDILNQDLERANERAANAEHLVDKLREQLDQAQQYMTSSTATNKNFDDNLSQEQSERKFREKLELELASKEREIAALVTDTQKLQSTLIKVKETSVSQISDLENVLNTKDKHIAQLESKLHSLADYDEIKRELTILKSIEFPSMNRSNDEQTNNLSKKSLETLLLEKNRTLQSENTQMKVANADLEIISLLSSNDTLQSSCNSLSVPVDTKYPLCPTMITPTAPLLLSTSSSSDLYSGQQLNSVQWTKLTCPSSSDVKSSISTPSINNSLEPLETTHVANIVRKILAQHNIGQRIFARYVLSLSQGTVSELLSKAKPWAKLTEKGKESYRKMWSWANSEESILALKSISPRKGSKDSTFTTIQQKLVQAVSDTQKPSRTPSASSSAASSRAPSPSEQNSFIPPAIFSAFVPSLLMQTTNRLKNESYPSYNVLCPQPDNYRNWLMLQEIVRNNTLFKQLKSSPDTDESEQENEDDIDKDTTEIPLDLSMKIDTDQTTINKQTVVKNNKTILTPLNEQDIAKYRCINTMELVTTVKDILSRYSISQRHFGEKILGLSQGSVSDILARPKQWELLTQKGREPFIRMRLFLDDSNAIKQLTHTVTLSSSPLTLNGCHLNNFVSNENSIDSQSNDCLHIVSNESLSSSSLNGTTISTTKINTNNNKKSKSRSKTNKDQLRPQLTTKSQMPLYDLPKISLPTTIDTEQLSSQVRELLSSYSIGQRVFGEAVLNLSQGTVSEILSKPRPWHALSVKGREPYIRMYSWFCDTDNVQKLFAWKQERDILRRSIRPTTKSQNHDTESNNNPTLKRRYIFTEDQRRRLKQIFESEPYPSQAKLEQLVDELSLPMNKILNWFHNARMRTEPNTYTKDTNKISSTPLTDNNDDDDGDNDEDENDDDDEDNTLP